MRIVLAEHALDRLRDILGLIENGGHDPESQPADLGLTRVSRSQVECPGGLPTEAAQSDPQQPAEHFAGSRHLTFDVRGNAALIDPRAARDGAGRPCLP